MNYTVQIELRNYRQVEIYSDKRLTPDELEKAARQEAIKEYGQFDEYELYDIYEDDDE